MQVLIFLKHRRIHTPGSGAMNSPKDRRRKRVKGGLYVSSRFHGL